MNSLRGSRGFALPVVMITSVTMMALLLVAISAISSISSSLQMQYYNRLAEEAAEAGINVVVECLYGGNDNIISASATPNSYKPNTTSCKDSTLVTNPSVMSPYIVNEPTYKTTYEVARPAKDSSSNFYLISATGITETYRSGATTPSKTYTAELKMRINAQGLVPTKSSSGPLYVCAIVTQKGWCWGNNKEGQLGIGSIGTGSYNWDNDTDRNPIRTEVLRKGSALAGYDKDIDVAAGNGTTCIITTKTSPNPNTEWQNRRVSCWGREEFGKFGNDVMPVQTTGTTQWYPKPTRFVGYRGGIYANTGLTRDNTYSWETQNQYPVQVVGGSNFFCALTATATGTKLNNLYCWGRNNKGQVGFGTPNSTLTYGMPQKVALANGNRGGAASEPGLNASYIHTSASARHVCAIQSSGAVYCWGDNEFGQVGDGTTATTVSTPAPVLIVGGGTTQFEAVDGGVAVGGHLGGSEDDGDSDGAGKSTTGLSCGIQKSDRKIYCWGSNVYGELGSNVAANATARQPRAKPINSVERYNGSTWLSYPYRAYALAISYQAACAIVEANFDTSDTAWERAVACWGDNQRGELGLGPNYLSGTGSFISVNRPRVIEKFLDGSLSVPTGLSGGAYRMCAIVGASNYCWGRDHTAQVGDRIPRADICEKPSPPSPWGPNVCSNSDRKLSEWYPKKSIFSEPRPIGVYY